MKKNVRLLAAGLLSLLLPACGIRGAAALPDIQAGADAMKKGLLFRFGGVEWRVISNTGNMDDQAQKAKARLCFCQELLAKVSWYNRNDTGDPYYESAGAGKIAFSDPEKSAVCATVHAGSEALDDSLNGEHLFSLSRSDPGFPYDGTNWESWAFPTDWWLRDRASEDCGAGLILSVMQYVGTGGNAGNQYPKMEIEQSEQMFHYVRPAFNLDASRVAMASAAGKKDTAAGVLTAVGDAGAAVIRKLTLTDGSRTFSSSASSLGADRGGRIAVPYAGARTGAGEYVSVLIFDRTGKKALYYGSVPAEAAEGTAEFTLPGALADGRYILKAFSERKNGENESDLASAFSSVTLTVGKKRYFAVSGDGQTWYRGTTNPARFTFKGYPNDGNTFANFTGIRVNGVDVSGEKYAAEPGSVVVTLKADYLEGLKDGSHRLTAVFTDGEADAGFKVQKSPGRQPADGGDMPKTGDGSQPALWGLLAAACAGAVAAIRIRRKKK